MLVPEEAADTAPLQARDFIIHGYFETIADFVAYFYCHRQGFPQAAHLPMIFSFRPNQLKKLRKYLQTFGAKVKEKGTAIYEKKGVSDLSAPEKQLVEAKIAGLDVTLEYSEDGWESWCTCATELECEHGYALGLAVLEGDATLEPDEVPEKGLDEKLSEALGRKLTGEERLFVQRLNKLFLSWETSDYLSDWDVQQLLSGWKFRTHTALQLWPAPPPDVETFWFYIAEAARQRDVAVPATSRCQIGRAHV